MAYDQFGKDTEMIVQDSSSFAAEGERISFLQVQVPSSSLLLPLYCAPVACTLAVMVQTFGLIASQLRHLQGGWPQGHRKAVPVHWQVTALQSSASQQCIL